VEDVLEKKYKDTPFDAILDAVGVQSLYENSPKYLKKQGIFLNVGALDASLPRTIWWWFKNTWWPSYLGGVPRRYIMFSTIFDQETSDILARFAADAKIKTFVTETFHMEDLVKVRESSSYMDT
jgi:D-arabinose 1-dehydrogenase-like Zn-dependent alcohol dehydrogenase